MGPSGPTGPYLGAMATRHFKSTWVQAPPAGRTACGLNAADPPQGFYKESTQGLFVSMLSDGPRALKRIQRHRRNPCDLYGRA